MRVCVQHIFSEIARIWGGGGGGDVKGRVWQRFPPWQLRLWGNPHRGVKGAPEALQLINTYSKLLC